MKPKINRPWVKRFMEFWKGCESRMVYEGACTIQVTEKKNNVGLTLSGNFRVFQTSDGIITAVPMEGKK